MLGNESTDKAQEVPLPLDSEAVPATPPRGTAPPSRIDIDVDWVARARKTFTFARRALDERARSGPDTVTGRALLIRTVEDLGTALQGGAPADFEASLARIEATFPASEATGVVARLASVEADALVDKVALAEIARAVETLVVRAERARKLGASNWIRRIGLVLLVAFAVSVVSVYTLSRPWVAYTFRTTSAYTGYKRTGKLGEAGERDLLFHTNEDESPSVEIDVGEVKNLHLVKIGNRRGCCTERAVPLVVEIATEPGKWKQVAERTERFDTWEATFPEQPARWVRLRVTRKTMFHLREIQVR